MFFNNEEEKRDRFKHMSEEQIKEIAIEAIIECREETIRAKNILKKLEQIIINE